MYSWTLHSIMLLLYRSKRPALVHPAVLYIPLCFYFIRSQHPHRQTQKAALHSIMLLLYLYPEKLMVALERLYIPLCFYFISYLETSIYVLSTLHSIMLLLYRITVVKCPGKHLTLHSIMLLLYRKCYTAYCPRKTPLHSIMLLLYPTWNAGAPRSCPLYIPLCFYFINKGKETKIL